MTDQLSESSDDIVGLMEQTNLVVSEVTARREAIHRLLRGDHGAVRRADRDRHADPGGPDSPRSGTSTWRSASLNKEDDALKKVLDVMAPAVRYVANATGNGPYVDLYGARPGDPGRRRALRGRGDLLMTRLLRLAPRRPCWSSLGHRLRARRRPRRQDHGHRLLPRLRRPVRRQRRRRPRRPGRQDHRRSSPTATGSRSTMEIDADRADPGGRRRRRGRPLGRHRPLRRADARSTTAARRWRTAPRSRSTAPRTPVDFDEVLETHQRRSPPGSPAPRRRTQARQALHRQRRGRLRRATASSSTGASASWPQAVSTMSGQREDIAETIVSLDVLVGTIAENDDTVRTFVDQVAAASRLLADERGNFRERAAGPGPGGHRGGGVRGRQPRRGRRRRSTTRPRCSGPCCASSNALTEILEVMPVTLREPDAPARSTDGSRSGSTRSMIAAARQRDPRAVRAAARWASATCSAAPTPTSRTGGRLPMSRVARVVVPLLGLLLVAGCGPGLKDVPLPGHRASPATRSRSGPTSPRRSTSPRAPRSRSTASTAARSRTSTSRTSTPRPRCWSRPTPSCARVRPPGCATRRRWASCSSTSPTPRRATALEDGDAARPRRHQHRADRRGRARPGLAARQRRRARAAADGHRGAQHRGRRPRGHGARAARAGPRRSSPRPTRRRPTSTGRCSSLASVSQTLRATART